MNDSGTGKIAWGSIQYSDSKDWFDKYNLTRLSTPREEVLTNFGFKLAGEMRSFEEAKAAILMEIGEDWFDPEDKEMFSRVKDADELMVSLRDMAWDLWSAAPALLQEFGFTLEDIREETPKEPGAEGMPIINQMIINSESALTGFACALLLELGIVKWEDSFEGFST